MLDQEVHEILGNSKMEPAEKLRLLEKKQNVKNFPAWFLNLCKVISKHPKFLGKLLATLPGAQLHFMEDTLIGLFTEAWKEKFPTLLSEKPDVKFPLAEEKPEVAVLPKH